MNRIWTNNCLLFVSLLLFNSFGAQSKLSSEDEAFINRCDSLLVAHFAHIDSFTADTTELNYYSYHKDSVPLVTDEEIVRRIQLLDEKSPFDFLANDVAIAMTRVYIKKRYRLTSRMLGLSQLYFPLFEQKLSAYHLPMELKYLPIVESALNPTATSRSGAGGLWQFMPATGKGYGLEIGSFIDERNDPYLATEAACKYLSKLYAIYGDWSLSLAAYNAGQGTVTKAIRRSGGKKDYWSIRPFLPKETQNYVPAFIAVNYVMNYASEHNIYPRTPVFQDFEMDTVHVNQRVDLGVVEAWLNYNRVKLAYINPMYLTEVIPADSVKKLPIKMPLELVGEFLAFEDSIYKYSSLEFKYWVANQMPARKEVIHTIKKGESLESLCSKYYCTEQDIKAWNILTKIRMRTGKRLVMFQLLKEPKDYKENYTETKDTPEKKETSSSNLVVEGNYKYHIVEKGDTLWDIAKKYNGSVEEIKKLNSHIDMSTLHTGTKLKISVK
jgi:membrane-bound lytic murein transglycosylase D